MPLFKRKAPDYLRPYQEAVAQVGPRFESLLWRNRDYQQTRFAVLAEAVDLSGRVVADLGCGNADLAAFCADHAVPLKRYLGVEGVPELAQQSRSRLAELRLPGEVLDADFAADARLFERLVGEHGVEVALFSGSLNTFAQDEALGVLDRAWRALAGKGGSGGGVGGGVLLFNFLSADAPDALPGEDTGPAVRFDPGVVLDWARARTPRIVFRQDYLGGHDATMALLPPVDA